MVHMLCDKETSVARLFLRSLCARCVQFRGSTHRLFCVGVFVSLLELDGVSSLGFFFQGWIWCSFSWGCEFAFSFRRCSSFTSVLLGSFICGLTKKKTQRERLVLLFSCPEVCRVERKSYGSGELRQSRCANIGMSFLVMTSAVGVCALWPKGEQVRVLSAIFGSVGGVLLLTSVTHLASEIPSGNRDTVRAGHKKFVDIVAP